MAHSITAALGARRSVGVFLRVDEVRCLSQDTCCAVSYIETVHINQVLPPCEKGDCLQGKRANMNIQKAYPSHIIRFMDSIESARLQDYL